MIGATVAREIGQVDLVGAGQAKQHIRRHRPLIALQKRDIGGGYIEIGRHVGLGEPRSRRRRRSRGPMKIERAVEVAMTEFREM